MSLSIYRASIPVLIRAFENLGAVLAKAEAHAAARNIDPAIFTGARLAPDMHPLFRQVHLASDSAKGCAARLAGIENPSFADTEKTFPELQARIAKTVTFLRAVTEAQLAGAEDRMITLNLGTREANFTGADYLFNFVLPNFFFHIATAYDILRHNGVEIGKLDYLGRL
nr:DUF1993 family protein [uncultured Dongia sp.]